MAVMSLLAILVLPARASNYGQHGWEGYGWRAASRVSIDLVLPNIRGARGDSVAFWAGFGHGDPGIQQAGITGTVGSGWTAWWELWPGEAVPFRPPVPPHSGDLVQFIVTHSGSTYVMTVNDEARHWSVSMRQSSGNEEAGGEAIVEAYGPDLPYFWPARFSYSNEPLAAQYAFPFGGTTIRATSARSFYVSKP